MSFRIAIPSYKRAEMLSQKTLRFLAEQNVDMSLIDIFVADEEERKEYQEKLTEGTYSKLIVGYPGISRQRSFITEYYPEGQKVFSIDDDIRGIATINPIFDLTNFLEMMFRLCEEQNCSMWGVYPASSLLYLKNEIRKGVFYIVGCFYGFINKRNTWYPNLDGKEDMWASLQRCKEDGAVLRCTWVAPKTTYWLKTGGLHAAGRTMEREKMWCDTLATMFPEYVEKVFIRRNLHPEVKLKRLPYTLV